MVIIAANENAAEGLAQKLSLVPQIEGSGPALFLGHPNIEAGAAPRRCAWAYDAFTEQQIDLISAVVEAEGAAAYFSTAASLPGDWRH